MAIQVFVAIDGEISIVDLYLTMSHKFLFKENDFLAIDQGEGEKGMLCWRNSYRKVT